MNKEWLIFAGEMAIVSAVITLPSVVAFYFMDQMQGLVPKISISILSLIGLCFYIYLISMLKLVLNRLFQFFRVDFYIYLLIGINLIGTILNLLYVFYQDMPYLSTVLMGLTFLFVVLFGLFLILFGFRLMNLNQDLYGLLKPYCYTLMIGGACFAVIILFPVGYIASVVSDVLLAIIFFRAAKQLESNPLPE